ncbi:MAG TPA: glycogen debranching N-terminal domain-containing protein [Acidimicrobiales bacterium]|nr:glycogen debranching N-terminal domain-containing protein [Acidimicrobiales bacterium]
MRDPLDAVSDAVPSIGRRQLVLVDGRTFAISDEAGQMTTATHGLVHDDLRHLSLFAVTVDEGEMEVLASSAPTPLSAVVVARLGKGGDASSRAVLTRRRWVAGGLREDVHVHNTSPRRQRWTLRLRLAADFAHVFDVKAGHSGTDRGLVADDEGWTIDSADATARTCVRAAPLPDEVDLSSGTLTWRLDVDGRSEAMISVTVEPVVDDEPAGLAFPCGSVPGDAIPMRRLASWQASVPRVVSKDPRLSLVVEQALADIAALRIIDSAHVDRPVIAAGAPWFMTLFGRDSLITSWMTLPFDPELAVGVLSTLAELQGRDHDPVAEEQPGKILHELRRHGGGGPFGNRRRYYGTVDATPLFVMLAAETRRWGALRDTEMRELAPAVDAALTWILGHGDSNCDGLVDYRRSDASGLSNQGWKDSWDGVTFADGSLAKGPIALAEVQGYVYAALLGAAELVGPMGIARDSGELLERAARLKVEFNESFWDERGWFAMGLDGDGHRIDSLTTNPGHALWTGIADADHANEYLEQLMQPSMWTGWGLRTLADTMAAYDPLSYHNGSVWPHDTAICAAGAARYGRWDIVDRIIDGAFDAASEFDGRPPELFAGIARAEAPMPVAYPASCSPQAWSSASVLLSMRSMLDLGPSADGASLCIGREDLSQVPDMSIERIRFAGSTVTVTVDGGVGEVTGS